MNFVHILIAFLSPGLISALILLIVPKVNYLVKATLVSFTASLWICISIIFLAINLTYIFTESTGIFIFLSAICGMVLSILAGGLIMAFFLEKKKSQDSSNE